MVSIDGAGGRRRGGETGMAQITVIKVGTDQWAKPAQRQTVRRRAIRMGADHPDHEVEIRSALDGALLDSIPSDNDARACGYAIDRDV
jgi:hypothetical protein